MTEFMTIVIGTSIAGLAAISIFRFVKLKNVTAFAIQLAVLGLAAWLIYTLFYTPGAPVARGDDDGGDVYLIIWLFIFMVLGMLANYLYQYFSKPKAARDKLEFDIGLFIAPVFVSPIIFIPLLVVFQEGNVSPDGNLTARIMFFLVAFQNGFLWKEYFDNLRKQTAEGRA